MRQSGALRIVAISALALALAALGLWLSAPASAAPLAGDSFTLQLSGQVVASQIDATNPAQRVVTQTLLLRTVAGQQPNVALTLDITETIGPDDAGNLTGTATLADVTGQTPIFTAQATGTVNPGDVVLYHLSSPQAATGSGGALAWRGAIRSTTFGALTGTAVGSLALPDGVPPAVAQSIWPLGGAANADPTLWYITRGAASAAYLLLALTTALGLAISTRALDSVVKRWRVLDLHQALTLLLAALIALHLVTLAFDPYLPFGLLHLLWPVGEPYQAIPVAAGVISLYLLLAVTLSSWVRARLPYRLWRGTHYLSFAAFVLLTLHGIFAGTDTTTVPLLATYATSCLLVGALTVLRVAQR